MRVSKRAGVVRTGELLPREILMSYLPCVVRLSAGWAADLPSPEQEDIKYLKTTQWGKTHRRLEHELFLILIVSVPASGRDGAWRKQ